MTSVQWLRGGEVFFSDYRPKVVKGEAPAMKFMWRMHPSRRWFDGRAAALGLGFAVDHVELALPSLLIGEMGHACDPDAHNLINITPALIGRDVDSQSRREGNTSARLPGQPASRVEPGEQGDRG